LPVLPLWTWLRAGRRRGSAIDHVARGRRRVDQEIQLTLLSERLSAVFLLLLPPHGQTDDTIRYEMLF